MYEFTLQTLHHLCFSTAIHILSRHYITTAPSFQSICPPFWILGYSPGIHSPLPLHSIPINMYPLMSMVYSLVIKSSLPLHSNLCVSPYGYGILSSDSITAAPSFQSICTPLLVLVFYPAITLLLPLHSRHWYGVLSWNSFSTAPPFQSICAPLLGMGVLSWHSFTTAPLFQSLCTP